MSAAGPVQRSSWQVRWLRCGRTAASGSTGRRQGARGGAGTRRAEGKRDAETTKPPSQTPGAPARAAKCSGEARPLGRWPGPRRALLPLPEPRRARHRAGARGRSSHSGSAAAELVSGSRSSGAPCAALACRCARAELECRHLGEPQRQLNSLPLMSQKRSP